MREIPENKFSLATFLPLCEPCAVRAVSCGRGIGFKPVRFQQKMLGNHENLRIKVMKKRTGWKPIVFGPGFAVSSNARLAAFLPAEFASRIWHVAKPVMLDVLVHYENGSQ